MKVFPDSLDQAGKATYTFDYTKECLALGPTVYLASMNIVLSAASIAAGLLVEPNAIGATDTIFTCRFSIPDVDDQVFSRKGKVLDMEAFWVTTSGEQDSDRVGVIIKDK